MFKAVISDFDGTLAATDKTVAAENIKAIKRLTENGYKFALSTGRMTFSALNVAKALPIKTLVGSFNGGEITDTVTGETLYSNALTYDECMPLVDYAIKKDVNCQVYSGTGIFPRRLTQYTEMYAGVCGCEVYSTSDIRESLKNLGKTPKFMIIDDRAEEIFPEVVELFGGKYEIAQCHKGMIDFNPLNTNKGSAVVAFSKIWGIDPSECITIGDEGNDIPMFKNSGLGIAVANAVDTVKNNADFVMHETNDACAVAKAINKFIFGEE